MQRIPNQPSPSPLHFVGRGDCMHAHSCFILPTVTMRDVKIHPTPLVYPAARIGADGEVRPLSMIRPRGATGNRAIVKWPGAIQAQERSARGNSARHGALSAA